MDGAWSGIDLLGGQRFLQLVNALLHFFHEGLVFRRGQGFLILQLRPNLIQSRKKEKELLTKLEKTEWILEKERERERVIITEENWVERAWIAKESHVFRETAMEILKWLWFLKELSKLRRTSKAFEKEKERRIYRGDRSLAGESLMTWQRRLVLFITCLN